MLSRVESYESSFSVSSTDLQGMEASRSLFESAETPQDLQRLTIAFLRGELTSTCYHIGPPMPESNEIVDKLVRINELGFITTGSQPGKVGAEHVGQPHQRCYVEGILKRRWLGVFRFLLAAAMQNEVFVYSHNGNDEMSFEEIRHLQHVDLYWVTKERLAREGGRGITHIAEYTGPCQAFQTCSDVIADLEEEYVNVFVFDTVWGRKDVLLDRIIDVLTTVLRDATEAERLRVGSGRWNAVTS